MTKSTPPTSSSSSPQSLLAALEQKTRSLTRQLPYVDVLEEKSLLLTKAFLSKDYFTVGAASAFSCCVSHPLDLVKVRFQLQGELRPVGTYPLKYRNIPQSIRDVVRDEGLRGLYKGVMPGFIYQFLMNTVRASVFDTCNSWGLTSDFDEEPVLWRYAAVCALSGSAGAVLASPAYLAKIQTQSQASPKMAVGWQHSHPKSRWVIWNAFRGHRGKFKSGFQGGTSAVMRVSLASTVQLLSFTTIQHGFYSLGVQSALINSCLSGVVSSIPVVLISNPMDVICTRMYNQDLGAYYKSNRECFEKLYQREGWRGFYKGAFANYCRTVPHMICTLLLWDHFKRNSINLSLTLHPKSSEFHLNGFDEGHKNIISKFELEFDDED